MKQLWMIYYCLHQGNKVHMDKLEDLLKALRKNWSEDISKEMSVI